MILFYTLQKVKTRLNTTTMKKLTRSIVILIVLCATVTITAHAQLGVGAKAPKGAEVFFDGSQGMLHAKWTYWKGPRLKATLPIKWQMVKDPVDNGMVMNSNDPAAAGGLYGAADIVTKKEFRDFRAHVEFLIEKPEATVVCIYKTVMRFRCWMVTLLRMD